MIRKLRRLLGLPQKAPAIRLQKLATKYLGRGLIWESGKREPGQNLLSDLCRFDALDSPTFRKWIAELRLPWQAQRKEWELAYILQGLSERDMIAPGRKGLAFAVGQERLPALLASRGCQIVATDLEAGNPNSQPWAETGQWSGDRDALNKDGLCDPETFSQNVSFRPVDMNAIPDDLRGFDFTWSTCSFEHCGSIESGLQFLVGQMDCLRPGGIAIHTTELNLTSDDQTITEGITVVFRLQDIERVITKLRAAGHHVELLDLRLGDHPYDQWVDVPPYHSDSAIKRAHYSHLDRLVPGRRQIAGHDKPHMRLKLGKFASTSIGLIIRKAG
jgi:hypothetical protein